jgi:hypothetical protein
MKGFIMSSVVWWYIWIFIKSYLETGLFLSLLFLIITIINGTINRMWLRDFVFTVFLHPVVIYYFIKELENGNRSK